MSDNKEIQALEWLEGNELSYTIWNNKYRYNNESFNEWLDRVSGGNIEIRNLIKSKKFLFGGRTLSNRGTNKGSYNNCFVSTTKIVTNLGMKTLKELYDNKEPFKVLSGNGSFEDATIQSFGKQKLVKLTLIKNGKTKEFTTTKDHIWFANPSRLTKKETYSEVTTENLNVGDILRSSGSKCFKTYKPSPFGIAHGAFYGDGSHTGNCRKMYFCEDKVELLPYFTPDTINNNNGVVVVNSIPKFMGKKPNLKETKSYLYGWLAGYFATDGHLSSNGTCSISSSKIENIKTVIDVCCVLGIPVNEIKTQNRLSNLNNTYSDIFSVTFSRYYLNDSFFIRTKHKKVLSAIKEASKPNRWRVHSIEFLKKEEEVFCAVVPTTHNFTLEGFILTHNCYSIGYVPDSLEGILDVNTKIALTYKAQGGQGLSLSKIRPKGSYIKDMFKSDGIVPFMEIFNTTTDSISQGGSRKGALLMSLDIWHPEIETFIKIKSDESKITKANLSVEIDDEFMEYIEEYISTGNKPIIDKVFSINNSYEYKYSVDVVNVFYTICEYAKKHAEPGIIFTNRFRNFNIMEFIEAYQIETGNPCGEQPLPKNGCCALSSINLSEYVLNPYTDPIINFDSFGKDLYNVVQAMDDLIDENLENHALQEQRDAAFNYRNIGIGYMGVADMLVKLGITYGSDESVTAIHNIGSFMFKTCVRASVALAKDRGSFPMYNSKVFDSSIMKNHFSKEELDYFKTIGLRNCALLSIAPNGSIGTMLNVSTGCEPYFALSYNRKTVSLHNNKEEIYKVYIKEADYYINNINEVLPSTFVESKDISYIDRIKMQGAMQDHIDTAISSTINLPANTTTEEVFKLYFLSWKFGLKGVTIYVEGSRAPILSTSDITNNSYVKRPSVLEADFHTVKVKGEQFIVLVGLFNGKPYEVFTFRPLQPVSIDPHRGKITKVKKMHYRFDSEYIELTDLQYANKNIEENAVTLNASLALRHHIEIPHIVKVTKKVNENITSFSSAMCRILSKYIQDGFTGDVCMECGGNLKREGGCVSCVECGDSKCS